MLLSRPAGFRDISQHFSHHRRHPVCLAHSSSQSRTSCHSTADSYNSAPAADDFYKLLGVEPTATTSEIKGAYRQLMRLLHPDLSAALGDEAITQANALAALLNEIYDTLNDPDKRATYNALIGLGDASAINPFLDTSFERDQAFVDEIACIGCGKCVRQCPRTFEIESTKYGRARVISQAADTPEDIEIAMEVCPVSCIYWVTLPQLTLLEAALAVMPRVEVFIMQRSGNRPTGSVFEEAFKAFERRRSAAAARAAAAAASQAMQQGAGYGGGSAGMWKMPNWDRWVSDRAATAAAGGSSGAGSEQAQDPNARRIAGLAAAAARAARLWRAAGGGRRSPKALLSAGEQEAG